MKRILLMTLAAALLGMAACKKDKDEDPVVNEPTPKVKTIKRTQAGFASVTETYTYDALGRIQAVTHSNDYVVQAMYMAGMVMVTITYGGANFGSQDWWLNAQGRADSGYSTNPVITTRSGYEYDSAGYQLEQRVYGFGNVYSYTARSVWQAGNQVDQYLVDAANVSFQHRHYTYDTEHKNTIGNQNTGYDFLGLSPANPVTYEVVSGNELQIYRYTYTYDSKGRIATKTSFGPDGRQTGFYEYTYY